MRIARRLIGPVGINHASGSMSCMHKPSASSGPMLEIQLMMPPVNIDSLKQWLIATMMKS